MFNGSRLVWRAFARFFVRSLAFIAVFTSLPVFAYPAPDFVFNPATSSSDRYVVSWTPVDLFDLDHYRVYESKDGGAFVLIGYPGVNEFEVSGRTNGSYRYRVAACSMDMQCSAQREGSNPTVVSLSPPAANISANPTHIAANGSSTISWSSSGADNCKLGTVFVSMSGQQTFYNIASTTTYTLVCTNGAGPTQVSATVTIVPPPAITGQYATPNPVARGQTTKIYWNVSNATSCNVNGVNATSPYTTPVINGDQDFTISCSGTGGTDSKVVSVSAPSPASITAFTATNNPIETGTQAKLNWATTNATQCTLNTVSVGTTANNYLVGPLSANTNYTLSCSGVSGSDSKSLTVVVAPKTIVNSFSADVTPIAAGQSTTVRWNVSNANSCTLNSNNVSAVGSVSTGVLNSATNYRLQCAGTINNIDQTLTVTVNPAPSITSFTAAQNPIAIGSSTTLQWATSNASNCNIDGVSVLVNGTKSSGVLSAPKTFRLTCVGTNNSTTFKDLTVTATSAPVASFTAVYSFVEVGSSTTLSWSSQNSSACTLNNASVVLNGSQSTGSITANKTFTLKCTSQVGQVEKQVTITALPLQTLWRDMGMCDPRTGKVHQQCVDGRGCTVSDTRTIAGTCAESADCQP